MVFGAADVLGDLRPRRSQNSTLEHVVARVEERSSDAEHAAQVLADHHNRVAHLEPPESKSDCGAGDDVTVRGPT